MKNNFQEFKPAIAIVEIWMDFGIVKKEEQTGVRQMLLNMMCKPAFSLWMTGEMAISYLALSVGGTATDLFLVV